MQIQVSTDNHTAGSAELTRQVESVVEGALGRGLCPRQEDTEDAVQEIFVEI